MIAQDLFVSEVVRIGENSTPLSPSNAGISDTNSAQFYDFQETESDATDSACKVEALQFLSDPSHELDQLKRYPTVAKAFVKFNTTVPSSAPVERLFSQAGLILTPRRNSLSDEFFETLLLLKKNANFSA